MRPGSPIRQTGVFVGLPYILDTIWTQFLCLAKPWTRQHLGMLIEDPAVELHSQLADEYERKHLAPLSLDVQHSQIDLVEDRDATRIHPIAPRYDR